MARYTGAACRICRRENLKMYLKGDRCYSDKCSFERRSFAPGQHGHNRFRKVSDYAVQLREKQKVKKMYGMLEKQFRLYFHKADQAKGVTGENLLIMLERRLDNTVYRLGFAASRQQARQLVRHNHFLINGKKVNIPSYQVSPSDVISVSDKAKEQLRIKSALEIAAGRGLPAWVEVDVNKMEGVFKNMPDRSDLPPSINEHLIVELYSK